LFVKPLSPDYAIGTKAKEEEREDLLRTPNSDIIGTQVKKRIYPL